MRNVQVKLVTSKNKALSNAQVTKQINKILQAPLQGRAIDIGAATNLDALRIELESTFDCTARSGVTDGCYGSSSGAISEGLTIYMHAKELTERYVDAEYGEQVNPYHLLMEHGELVEGLDGETFEQFADELGLETKSDNTYNYATDFGSEHSDCAGFMFDFQFTTLEKKDGGAIVAVMFHCGGDPRGNYTDKYVFKFKYLDDLYNVLLPSKFLTDEAV